MSRIIWLQTPIPATIEGQVTWFIKVTNQGDSAPEVSSSDEGIMKPLGSQWNADTQILQQIIKRKARGWATISVTAGDGTASSRATRRPQWRKTPNPAPNARLGNTTVNWCLCVVGAESTDTVTLDLPTGGPSDIVSVTTDSADWEDAEKRFKVKGTVTRVGNGLGQINVSVQSQGSDDKEVIGFRSVFVGQILGYSPDGTLWGSSSNFWGVLPTAPPDVPTDDCMVGKNAGVSWVPPTPVDAELPAPVPTTCCDNVEIPEMVVVPDVACYILNMSVTEDLRGGETTRAFFPVTSIDTSSCDDD